jgi:type II restriction enzyme
MELRLDATHADGYKSRSQIARRVTEYWATENLYCIACTADRLSPTATNTAVVDYLCLRCGGRYQLKSKNSPFGSVVTNSAYSKKMQAIERGDVPHYAFLQYSLDSWTVHDLFVVPGYLISPGVIQERSPLKKTARRAGWIGSNVLLGRLPEGGRVSVVANGQVRNPRTVRAEWNRYRFLERDAAGGWGGDILAYVHELRPPGTAPEFTLREFYDRFTKRLASQHPSNKNVEAKIRQQLQFLRDGGTLEFLGRGRYRLRTH